MARTCLPRALLSLALLACSESEPGAGPASVPQVDPAELEQLAQLGYGDWSGKLAPKTIEDSGVVRSDPGRAYPGFNLYTSLPSREAHLFDMEGDVVHTWTAPPDEGDPWHHVELGDDGSLFALANGPLEKLDRDSRVLWRAPLKAHHDLDVGPDGRLYVLSSRLRHFGAKKLPLIDDEIAVLEPDGRIVRRIPFTEVFPEVVTPELLGEIEAFLQEWELRKEDPELTLARTGTPLDLFHVNSIELLDRDVPGLGKAGHALVSLRSLDRIAVIDLERSRVTWSFGVDVLERPHHATLLPGGRVSVFDNGWFREGSRVLRITKGGQIAWQYPARLGIQFFSRRRGAAQHLPNGNVLITESARGRAFEITPAGETIWEFRNPQVDRESRRRAQIYRVERISPERVAPLLGG